MSRKEELFKLAKLFYSQANATLSPAAKKSLRKLGDQYDREARHLKTEHPHGRTSSAAGSREFHRDLLKA